MNQDQEIIFFQDRKTRAKVGYDLLQAEQRPRPATAARIQHV